MERLINDLLKLALKLDASDIHLTVNNLPVLRCDGKLLAIDALKDKQDIELDSSWFKNLTAQDTEHLAGQILPFALKENILKTGEHDFSFFTPEAGRFRANIYRQRNGISLALRPVKEKIPSLKELGLPELVGRLARLPRGLVLVTGPSGCGKSTTLAAMIDLINQTYFYHIITIEDPIEYVFENKNCLISQREVGQDTASFALALRAALREDPDVILVGEMRDLETMSNAITAAETGHLVLSTLHTSGTVPAIERIIDVFPPQQQQQIRVQLASVLTGVIAQQLLPRQDKPGRVVAAEIMTINPAVKNLIRENKIHQIPTLLQAGAKSGMQTMEHSLRGLYRQGIISKEEAINRAFDPEGLKQMIF